MEAFALSSLRKALELSTTQMAGILGLEGDNAADKVREMERGRAISGPMKRILGYLRQAVVLDGDNHGELFSRAVPVWLSCADLESNGISGQLIMHTMWPRFYGWIAAEIDPVTANTLTQAHIPIFPMAPDVGHLVVFFIDRPVTDTSDLISHAVHLIEAQARKRLA